MRLRRENESPMAKCAVDLAGKQAVCSGFCHHVLPWGFAIGSPGNRSSPTPRGPGHRACWTDLHRPHSACLPSCQLVRSVSFLTVVVDNGNVGIWFLFRRHSTCRSSNGERFIKGVITETNRMHLVILYMQNRILGLYFAAMNRMLIPVQPHRPALGVHCTHLFGCVHVQCWQASSSATPSRWISTRSLSSYSPSA
jgi:hypothetical protein